MFNHSRIKTGSRGHTSPRSCGRGHHLGDSYTAHRASRGGSPQARHPHNHRNHPFRNAAVTPRSTLNVSRYDDDFPIPDYGNHIRNSMHALEEAMSNLDRRLGGVRQSHESHRSISSGSRFPFNQGGQNHIPDISGLHISELEDAFSHPIFSGHRSATRPEFMLHSFEPARHSSRSGIPSQRHIEHIPHQGFQAGDYLPFDHLPTEPEEDMYDLGSVLYSYFPEEFDPNPVAEDRVPTERSERRINHFIAQHTEPLTAANTTSTTNTDCPICMEDATAHDCVKIKGIVGCEHMIGQNCLKEFLSRQWNRDKTCPLCRAVWLRNGVWEDVAAQSDGPTGRQGASFGHGNRNRRERGMDRVRGLLRSARGQQRRRNN